MTFSMSGFVRMGRSTELVGAMVLLALSAAVSPVGASTGEASPAGASPAGASPAGASPAGASPAGASPAGASTIVVQPDDAPRQTDPSSLRIDLPRTHLSGYSRDIRGEILDYHSPVPTITSSLLVRSEDRGRYIAWESQPVPQDFQGEEAT
ncbi:MAG: hypothetical protein HKO65_10840, partial [Gemmatimonadetes bacterium]|nr:hypothetical protein [Gemmatimonadota bacterium]